MFTGAIIGPDLDNLLVSAPRLALAIHSGPVRLPSGNFQVMVIPVASAKGSIKAKNEGPTLIRGGEVCSMVPRVAKLFVSKWVKTGWCSKKLN